MLGHLFGAVSVIKTFQHHQRSCLPGLSHCSSCHWCWRTSPCWRWWGSYIAQDLAVPHQASLLHLLCSSFSGVLLSQCILLNDSHSSWRHPCSGASWASCCSFSSSSSVYFAFLFSLPFLFFIFLQPLFSLPSYFKTLRLCSLPVPSYFL